jgi:hypothetical protein
MATTRGRLPTPVQRTESGIAPHIFMLQQQLGNAAVARLLQRTVRRDTDKGWGDAVGGGWNEDRRTVEDIDRYPIADLGDFGVDQSGQSDEEKQTKFKHHTSESAGHRCIALVPQALNPAEPTDVLLHFHGFTNRSADPYAGWRQRDDGSVRDVAQDRIEAQMRASGATQTIAILPQGISHSQFGKVPTDPYIRAVLDRLRDRGVKLHKDYRVILSAHSGGGNTVIANLNKEAGGKGHHAAEVVLFEAMWEGNQQQAVSRWATTQLDKASTAIEHASSDAEKQEAVAACPVLRAYYSGATAVYVRSYTALDGDLQAWFGAHADKLGKYADVLRGHFQVRKVGGTNHESLIHGLGGPEAGPLADALRAEHAPEAKSLLEDGSSVTPRKKKAKAKAKRRRGSSAPDAGGPAGPTTPTTGTTNTTGTVTGSSGTSTSGTTGAGTTTVADTDAIKKGSGRKAKKKSARASKAPLDRAQMIALAIDMAKHGGDAGDAAEVAADIGKAKDADGIKYDVDTWFASFNPDATFLGLHIRPTSDGEATGVHSQMATVLTAAESNLVKSGESVEQARDRLGVHDVGGLRRPKAATGGSRPSMHCFGMAVDIEAANNPFLGNQKNHHAIEIAERATLLLSGSAHDPRALPPNIKGKGKHRTDSEADRTARAERAGEQWEKLHADSDMVQRYLNLSSEELDSILEKRLEAITAWAEKSHKSSTLSGQPVTDASWWHAELEKDQAHPRGGDFTKASDPKKHGYMTVQKELVTALVGAGLTWGGVYNTGKDLMHFDLRTGSIGGRPVA